MIEILFLALAILSIALSFSSAILLAKSNLKFTKGAIQEVVKTFAWATICLFGAVFAQMEIDIFNLAGTPLDFIKYFFFLLSLSFYLKASYKLYRISLVLGFASREMPKKLKRVLKS
jgi:hypothetical protein